MRKPVIYILSALCLSIFHNVSFAQGGGVYTLAGGGTFTTDGIPATNQQLITPAGIYVDHSGNTYIADNGGNIVHKVNSSGLGYKIAGTGTPGFSGDAGPAVAAQLSGPKMLCTDAAGNVYIADAGNNRIRKVNVTTGIITTVAGGGSSAADGIPATAASINAMAVCVDAAGNIYTGGTNCVRKVNAVTGLITTIAGNGAAIDTGDGGAATAASLNGAPRCLTLDQSGNLYIIASTGNSGPASMRIRKMDLTTGIITTIAGGGSLTSEDVPAICSSLSDIYSCVVDGGGNIFVADKGHNLIRRINGVSNIIETVAGVGTSTAEGVAAIYSFTPNQYLALDSFYIYYSDRGVRVRHFSFYPLHGPAIFTGLYGSDSLQVSVTRYCSGPIFTARTHSHHTAATVKTWFGDGNNVTANFLPSCVSAGQDVTFSHSYSTAGTYRVKHVLYYGSAAIDSVSYGYTNLTCNTMAFKLYYDVNMDCIKNDTEIYSPVPAIVVVDTNGVTIDTIPTTAGFSYDAYGPVGTVYSFHALSNYMYSSCPVSAVLSDTIMPGPNTYPVKLFAINNIPGGPVDNSAYGILQAGRHLGHASILTNTTNYLSPTTINEEFAFSPKYSGLYSVATPLATSSSSQSVTWVLPISHVSNGTLINSYVSISGGWLTVGDTVHSSFTLTPFAGDCDITNNNNDRVDTVKASFDPNLINVVPDRCFNSTGPLKYMVHFENTGNDTAHNVYVLDTLSANVESQSIRILSSSADVYFSKYNAGGLTVARFDFPNINLQDSAHHGFNDGMFVFSVMPKASLSYGAIIDNRAGIYFDVNDVVMTNSVENVKGCGGALGTAQLPQEEPSISPNPAAGEITIQTDGSYKSFALFTSMGQLVFERELDGKATNVNISFLSSGVYYITLNEQDAATNSRKVLKLVKW
jgi:hypothetical protein